MTRPYLAGSTACACFGSGDRPSPPYAGISPLPSCTNCGCTTCPVIPSHSSHEMSHPCRSKRRSRRRRKMRRRRWWWWRGQGHGGGGWGFKRYIENTLLHRISFHFNNSSLTLLNQKQACPCAPDTLRGSALFASGAAHLSYLRRGGENKGKKSG